MKLFKILCLALVIISIGTSIGCSCSSEAELIIDINESSRKGQISGEITVEGCEEECTLYFGDSSGSKLEGFTKIGSCKEDKGYTLSGLIIPPEAKTIVADVKDSEDFFCEIPSKYLLDSDPYIFGALSDVHYNKYKATGEDDALVFFDHALDFFEEKSVKMVGVTGDISNDGEESALVKFNEATKDRSYPVFTVTGNHDIPAYKNGLWEQHITANVEDCIFADYGTDFVYAPEEMGGDVFVFLNMVSWDYADKHERALRGYQLNWLKSVLEEHKEDTVYLFFHLFMCGPDGQKHTGVGNIMNPGGYTYPIPFNYANADERIFRKYMQDYKNVVYFSGHSHWMFEMEIYGEQANYSNFDGTYCHMVHVPSVTEPRWIGENDTNRTGKNGEYSQGWIIYDYGDATVLVPVDFISQTYYTEYMEIIYK